MYVCGGWVGGGGGNVIQSPPYRVRVLYIVRALGWCPSFLGWYSGRVRLQRLTMLAVQGSPHYHVNHGQHYVNSPQCSPIKSCGIKRVWSAVDCKYKFYMCFSQ